MTEMNEFNPTIREGDSYAYERFREIKARFLTRFVKAKTQKELMVAKGKFLESLVRLSFKRLHYKVRRYSGLYGNKGLDLQAISLRKKKVICIEVTNWAKASYPHYEYKPQKMRAFKGLNNEVKRLWIISYKESLDLSPKEEKRLGKSPYWIHFLELGRDFNYQDTGYNDYLEIKQKIEKYLEDLTETSIGEDGYEDG
jgi:hypothetical protein